MRLSNYLLVELASEYGKGITFIDIDETLFHTFAKILVLDEKTGRLIRELDNQEFNTYKLKPGEKYDFHEFKDAKMFRKTSIAIPKTIGRIKRMLQHIDRRESSIVFLTARGTFDNQQEFMKTFKEHGIPIEKLRVEFNPGGGSIASFKKSTMLNYLKSGEYRRVRLIDDDMANLRAFLKLRDTLPQEIIDRVKQRHHIAGEETIPPVDFYALLVDTSGKLKRVE